jgi:uncharacterized protein YgiM (DUF1202 family)
MLRLTLMLCIGMFAALMIAGQDRGQLRPGLAEAAAKAALPVEADEEPAEAIVRVEAAPASESVAARAPVPETTVVARAEPDPYVEPIRETVSDVEEPIFSLSSVGNEAVPAEAAASEPEGAGAGTIWYVNASSVNVRAEPSTQAEVLDKLGSGEAALLVQEIDGEWARIVIQGDGVEGYVALRYLSPEAP